MRIRCFCSRLGWQTELSDKAERQTDKQNRTCTRLSQAGYFYTVTDLGLAVSTFLLSARISVQCEHQLKYAFDLVILSLAAISITYHCTWA